MQGWQWISKISVVENEQSMEKNRCRMELMSIDQCEIGSTTES
jgi:hypothetical protein